MKYFLRILCLVGLHDWVAIMGKKRRCCSRCLKLQVCDGTGKWRNEKTWLKGDGR